MIEINTRPNPQIGKQVWIENEEGQVVDFKNGKYIIFTESGGEHQLEDLSDVFSPPKSHQTPTAYIQISIIMEAVRYLVVPQKQDDGTHRAEIDYTIMGKSSEIRSAIKHLHDAVRCYDKGLQRRSVIPKEAFQRVADMGAPTLDTISLLYYAFLTLSLDKQKVLREEIEQMLWRITQTQE